MNSKDRVIYFMEREDLINNECKNTSHRRNVLGCAEAHGETMLGSVNFRIINIMEMDKVIINECTNISY